MNPGYAGRAELPDNLKALFRPCAMMVPDYAMIGEIRLYSFGFKSGKDMARKIVQVLRLSSEQLSSQKHYDYGMRAMNTILTAAGNLREEVDNSVWTEEMIALRSINDVNLPKFTVNDLPLFNGICADLFPGLKIPESDYGPLVPAICQTCVRRGLQATDEFVLKVVQLYETVVVRHGLMVVGETMAGKTKVIHNLAETITDLKDNDSFPKENGGVQVHTINPKALLNTQLYGNFDVNTHEWNDGVIPVIYRGCARSESPDRQWMVFDGPVDAVWIENMNTVLDNNQKLCLMSGEIIKMSSKMTMMFEAENLREASPATVSRVGMVFMEPERLGWEPLMESWFLQFPEAFREAHEESLRATMRWLIPPIIFFLKNECRMPTPVTELELIYSNLTLFACLINTMLESENGPPPEKEMPNALESLYFYSLVWSLGVCTDISGREKFSDFCQSYCLGIAGKLPVYELFVKKSGKDHDALYAMAKRELLCPLPEDQSVYNLWYSTGGKKWSLWEKQLSSNGFSIDRDATFHSILVPTVDTVRNAFVIDKLLQYNKNVLVTGDTGTGKSAAIKDKLNNHLSAQSYTTAFLNFSARTSANQTQFIIEGKLGKRRKGVLGPPLGKKCVIFVDDLNMPAKEEYGAQPPIELLRQWMDHGGWYDTKQNTFTEIVDVVFIAAMGPPGGGRTQITQRYIRHFNMMNIVAFDAQSLRSIFSTITKWYLSSFSGPLSRPALADSIVAVTIAMYDSITSSLLPTPAKSHYTFNLRDLSKVFQGLLQGDADIISKPIEMFRLWFHETTRVFHDRLIDASDRMWFFNETEKILDENTSFKLADVQGENKSLMYGVFLSEKVETEPESPKKGGGDSELAHVYQAYTELQDHEKLQAVMQEMLEDFNSMSSKPMSLVLFENAIVHICRISRVIRLPYGNALLVGMGGTGRKSLTTLAVFIADYDLFQIEISKTYDLVEWHEDLKKIYFKSGLEGRPTVFLLNDTQIVNETFVEDINNILNVGEVPNLFNVEEMSMIREGVSPFCAAAGKNPNVLSEVFSLFIERFRTNMHLVLCFSPIGDDFRRRLRMFPSLVNCCTIDWFDAWPDEALRSVAKHFFEKVDIPEEVKTGVIDVCVNMQQLVQELSLVYRDELRRYYYVTPTSYLELIKTFQTLLETERSKVMTSKRRYQNGLKKLLETAESVESMQEELKALQPKLVVATKETEELLVTIATKQKEANEFKASVAIEEQACQEQAAVAQGMKDECEADLAKALPALKRATKALQNLKKADIQEMKVLKKPPPAVKTTLKAVCIMMQVAPERIKNPDGPGKIQSYWKPGQKELLNDPNLVKRLLKYDKDEIPEEVLDGIRPMLEDPDFAPTVVKKSSTAAGGLCEWTHAIVIYYDTAKVVGPKKEALKEAKAALKLAQDNLEAKRQQLREIETKLQELQDDLQAAMQKKDDLNKQVKDCQDRLDRAERLISGLGGERDRWNENVASLGKKYDNIGASSGQVSVGLDWFRMMRAVFSCQLTHRADQR